jgi:hypothetical protein
VLRESNIFTPHPSLCSLIFTHFLFFFKKQTMARSKHASSTSSSYYIWPSGRRSRKLIIKRARDESAKLIDSFWQAAGKTLEPTSRRAPLLKKCTKPAARSLPKAKPAARSFPKAKPSALSPPKAKPSALSAAAKAWTTRKAVAAGGDYGASHSKAHCEWKVRMNEVILTLCDKLSMDRLRTNCLYLDDPIRAHSNTTSILLGGGIPSQRLYVANPDTKKAFELKQAGVGHMFRGTLSEALALDFRGVAFGVAYLDFCAGNVTLCVDAIRALFSTGFPSSVHGNVMILAYTIVGRSTEGSQTRRMRVIEGNLWYHAQNGGFPFIEPYHGDISDPDDLFEDCGIVTRFFVLRRNAPETYTKTSCGRCDSHVPPLDVSSALCDEPGCDWVVCGKCHPDLSAPLWCDAHTKSRR